jgi:molybdate transport system substrate-binding protein
MEIKILSAGAVQPGLSRVLDEFSQEFKHEVKVEFATAPALRRRLGAGERADVVIAPPDVIDHLANAGKVPAGERARVGRIGIGVAVRASAPVPGVATVDQFKQSLLDAQSIVYNQASTGIYLEKLFDRLGIGEQIRSKTTRYPDFAAVRDHVMRGRVREIGLGAATVIIECANQGLRFAGPLPAEIQNYTTYEAAVIVGTDAGEAAAALLRFLTSAKAKLLFATAGIE